MDFQTCIQEGKKALSEGRTVEARAWFERAVALRPEDWEAHLQFALSALLCGDRRTFETVIRARQAPPPEKASPRVQQLWHTALRFAGALATAATMVATVSACSSSSHETATTTASSTNETTVPSESVSMQQDSMMGSGEDMNAIEGDEVYSKHRYSAGVRPPMDVVPDTMNADAPTPDTMIAPTSDDMNPSPPLMKEPTSTNNDQVYSKHRYSAGVRPPVVSDVEELRPSMDATPVMKPDVMRPPAVKYGLYRLPKLDQ